MSVAGVLVGDAAGELRGRNVELPGQLALAPLLEAWTGGLEGAGFDDVATGLEESAMHALDDLGRVEREAVHPSLERGTAEVVDTGVLGLQTRPHRTVEDDDAIAQRIHEWRSILARH